MSAYEVIGKLYAFLNEYNSGELSEAARIVASTDLGNALQELSKVKQQQEGGRPQQDVRPAVRRHVDAPTDAPRKRNGVESKVSAIVLDSSLFASNVEVAKFLTSLGLGITFRKKDGRQLMLRKLMDALYTLDDEAKKRTLSKIYGMLPKSETAGWFDAIRGDGE